MVAEHIAAHGDEAVPHVVAVLPELRQLAGPASASFVIQQQLQRREHLNIEEVAPSLSVIRHSHPFRS